jgi:hypothetical protein
MLMPAPASDTPDVTALCQIKGVRVWRSEKAT